MAHHHTPYSSGNDDEEAVREEEDDDEPVMTRPVAQQPEECVSHVRESVHARGFCDRIKIRFCGDARSKDQCSSYWILVVVAVVGILVLFVILDNSDGGWSDVYLWVCLFAVALIITAITMCCFSGSTSSGEIGCARCCCDCSIGPITVDLRNASPPFHIGPPPAVMMVSDAPNFAIYSTLSKPPIAADILMPVMVPVQQQQQQQQQHTVIGNLQQKTFTLGDHDE